MFCVPVVTWLARDMGRESRPGIGSDQMLLYSRNWDQARRRPSAEMLIHSASSPVVSRTAAALGLPPEVSSTW